MRRVAALCVVVTAWPALAVAQEELSPPPPPPGQPPPPPPGYETAPPPSDPVPAPAYAPPPAAEPAAPPPTTSVHEHDGFFLRLSLGPAYVSSSGDARGFRATGGGLSFSVAIGGTVASSLVVYGVLYGAGAAGPTLEADGISRDTSSSMNLSYGGLGAGVQYFFMPINIYVAGSISLVNAEVSSEAEPVVTDGRVGFGARVMAGKEFWVSDNWGIGFAAELLLGTSSGDLYGRGTVDSDVRFTTFGAGIHFSATYN